MKKTTSLLFFLLTLCLISSSVAMAQTLTVTTNMDVYGPGETILVSGTAVANADVTVQLLNPNNQLVDIDYVRTGSDGKYSLSFKVPSTMPTGQWIYGTYTVKAFMGAQTAAKTITIQQKVEVKGKVVDASGAALAGATVAIDTATATTASDGTFTIYLPAAGTYTIKVSKANYYTYTKSITTVIGANDVGTIKLTSYEDKISELEVKIENLNKLIASLNGTIQGLQKSLQSNQADVAALKSTIQQLQTTIQQLQTLSSEVSSLRSSLSSATSDVASLKDQVSKLNSSLGSITSDITSLKDQVNRLQTTVAMATDLKSSVDALQSTVNSLKSSVDALQTSTSQLPLLYALALVGIIIAIIAVILVYRKIAA